MKKIKAKGWKGGTFGIRLGKGNAKNYFDHTWREVEVEIDGTVHNFKLSKTFWTTCPELRGRVLGDWLKKNFQVPWPPGNPPSVELIHLGKNRFRLTQG